MDRICMERCAGYVLSKLTQYTLLIVTIIMDSLCIENCTEYAVGEGHY
jgi:hypothetical protein